MDLKTQIEFAAGKRPVDLLLKNGNLVNVFSGEIYTASVAIHDDRIIGLGEYEAENVVDVSGYYLTPGFIDGHLHLESSMLSIPEFARNVVPLGTTTVVADPHEIANVMGPAGIRYMLDTSQNLPLTVYVMVPSCVPATPFETSGASLTAEDMKQFLNDERVLGLAEVMNFPGVVNEDTDVLEKIRLFHGRVIDGHSPGLSGKALNAYVGTGIGSDHECTAADEAWEKLRLGMRIMIREGSAAKNLDALLPVIKSLDSRNCLFVTDDIDPADILERGHLNRILRMAVARGVDRIQAVQMATINPASYFRLRDRGAIAPGYRADVLVLEDLDDFRVAKVFTGGRLVAENGEIAVDIPIGSTVDPRRANVDWAAVGDLSVNAAGESVNVIEVVPGEIVTRRIVVPAPVSQGKIVADPSRDLLKIAVIERHHGTGAHAVGLIKGFGLKRGAVGSSVAHDSHNIIVVGTNDEDMLAAGKAIADMGGGMVAVVDGRVEASLALPIAGLMSHEPIRTVQRNLVEVAKTAREMGCTLEAPFATLSFMALTPIPELKITDQGLFDSVHFQFVSLFA